MQRDLVKLIDELDGLEKELDARRYSIAKAYVSIIRKNLLAELKRLAEESKERHKFRDMGYIASLNTTEVRE